MQRDNRFADKLFVRISAIHFSGIEECHALIQGGADERNALAFVDGRPISMAQPALIKFESGTNRPMVYQEAATGVYVLLSADPATNVRFDPDPMKVARNAAKIQSNPDERKAIE